MTFKCKFEGLVLPLFGESEMDWPNPLRVILYLMGLGWIFLAVGLISDVFMNGIEKITSSKKRVKNKETGKSMTVYVWNDTVANLTLMALGSSAPEILLSLIEISSDNFFLGPLGAGTIVGSAAFNLLCISAVCVAAIPDGEVRYIKQVNVYIVTASCSVFAYLWLLFILVASSPDVCELWEALLTMAFCPILVFVAYLADRDMFPFSKCVKADALTDPDHHHHHETIPDDATPEELAAIEQHIRDEHGANLTQEQVIKIMKVQYFHKHSRAYYRHKAMAHTLHGHHNEIHAEAPPEFAIKEAINTSDDIAQEKMKKMVTIGFASGKYAVTENIGKAKVTLLRSGLTTCKASVKYATKEGTAKKGSDYEHAEGTVTFEKGETTKTIEISIKDDKEFENDEYFEIDLSGPSCEDDEENKGCQAQLSQFNTTHITIIDDDQPGVLRFVKEELEVVEGVSEQTLEVVVERIEGATGKISCSYHTDTMGAVEDVDYVGAKGTLEFETGVLTASIPVTIKAKGRVNDAKFNVVIEEVQGAKFDPKTDGGEEKCISHVVIKGKADGKNMYSAMKDRVLSANHIQGSKNWGQQFKDALFEVGGDDEDEEFEEGHVPDPPSKVDLFLHVICVPWKLLFAFVPPVDYCGGWACFCGALCMIAVVTAIVGDMANLVGCCFDVLPETAAITFVALGTSLPDTFASKTAAMMDPYADASIGNVTGSNSVNVFLGIGIAWTLAAVVWQVSDAPTADSEWVKRLAGESKSVQENVMKATDNGKSAIFISPGGTLWFNLMVFSVNAAFALQHLFARRKKWGGELGGPKKGFMGQYFSASFLIAQWFIYVIASIVFARTSGTALTYGDIANAP